MSGLLCLIGGQEHTAGCEDIDRFLLRDAGVTRPEVAVLLAGTSPRRRAFKIDEAQRYWAPFGAAVSFVFTGRPDEEEHGLQVLETADLIAFAGGHPWLFDARLQAAPAITHKVLERWAAGVPLSGSSAGAMALCEWRQRLRVPRPFTLVQGFGLVPGTAAAPHFSRYQMPRWAALTAQRHPHLRILGLEDRTALVGRGDAFQVRGRGRFTMVQAGSSRTYRVGEQVELAVG